MNAINFWPILVASIVSFGIGALWYSPILFGKEWMSLTKIKDSDIDDMKGRGVWKSYVIHFIFTLIMFCVLGFAVSEIGAMSASDGAILGFLAWIGFVLPMGMSEILWKKTSLKLVLIDSIHVLINLIIGGAIIGAWR